MPLQNTFSPAIIGLLTVFLTAEGHTRQQCAGYSRIAAVARAGWSHGGATVVIDSETDAEIFKAVRHLTQRAASFGRAGSETENAELPDMVLGTLGGRRDAIVRSYLNANSALIMPYANVAEYLTAHLSAMSFGRGALPSPRDQQINYYTSDNRIIAVAHLKFDPERNALALVHPSNLAAGIIFQDVRVRLRQLKANGSKFSFATAVQGWFNAMPFHTENARTPEESDLASFKSIYKTVFHSELKVDDDFQRQALGRSASDVEALLGLAGI